MQRSGTDPLLLARGSGSELAWDGRFLGLQGRATLLFDRQERLDQIALVLQAAQMAPGLFDRFSRQMAAAAPIAGAAGQLVRGTDDLTRLWSEGGAPLMALRWLAGGGGGGSGATTTSMFCCREFATEKPADKKSAASEIFTEFCISFNFLTSTLKAFWKNQP